MITAMTTVPWTCDADESRRPSGLHRSHSPTSSGTGAPHRTHGWVRCGRSRGTVGGGPSGAGSARVGRGHGPMVPRTAAWATGRASPSATSGRRPHERIDVGGRPRQHDRAVGAGRVPARPGLARLGDPGRCRRSTRRRASRPGTRRAPAGPRAASRPPRAPRGRAAGSPRSCRRTRSSRRRSGRPGGRPAGVSPPITIRGAGSGTG